MVTTAQETNRRMACMEIWGGNTAVSDVFETVGLDLHVQSDPYQASQVGGGDIYYVTSCASARITRLLLADVSGHGETASHLAGKLRDILRQHVNSIDQRSCVEQLNRQFGLAAKDSAFATALVATYFHPTRTLSIAMAGHPNPIGYDSKTARWKKLSPADRSGEAVSALPLGVDHDADYRTGKLQLTPGDMLLMYTDAFIEAEVTEGRMLGVDGLVALLNRIESEFGGDRRTPETIIRRLKSEINQLAPGALDLDDATVILGAFTETGPRLRDDAIAPIRLLTQVKDNTNIQ